MRVLEGHENAGEDGLLLFVIEVEVEGLELLADEAEGEDGGLLDGGVLVVDVGSDLLDDPLPLAEGDIDAAKDCDDLDGAAGTLAAALLMGLSGSTMVLRTASLNSDWAGLGTLCQRKLFSSWVRAGGTFSLTETSRTVPAESLSLLSTERLLKTFAVSWKNS